MVTVLEVWAPCELEAGLMLRLGTAWRGPHRAPIIEVKSLLTLKCLILGRTVQATLYNAQKGRLKRGWIRSVTLKFNKAWRQTTERDTCSLSYGTQMQTELLKAGECRAGSLGADSAKDTIMYIVGGIRYTLFVVRGIYCP